MGKRPGVTPYHYGLNNPIYNIDSDGEEAIGYIGDDGKLHIQVTYSYVSEGVGSFTDNEIKIMEEATNKMYGSAKGMMVDVNGTKYEIGSIEVKFEAGGTGFDVGQKRDADFGTNALFKAPSKTVEQVSKMVTGQPVSKETAAFTYSADGAGNSNGINNTTFIKESVFSNCLIDEVRNAYGNQNLDFQDGGDVGNVINDETGHQLGGTHDYDNIPEPAGYKYGKLEQSTMDSNGKLQLSQQDVQNHVNSREFKLVPKPK
jgi:hypothetical protein